ncbi:MAG: Cys-tRNA(Pro) deacylase [Desulfuromonadales bacterium]
MGKDKTPVTPATRLLKQAKIDYTPHLYNYEERGGTAVSACELEVNEHQVVKTLVMQDEKSNPLLVLMHGDREVSTKALARAINVKTVSPCTAETARKQTGYQVGGTSPFATRKTLPVYMEKTIQDLEKIYINGGKRGFLVGLSPQVVIDLLAPTLVDVGIQPS